MLILDGRFSTKDDVLILEDGPEWTKRSLWEIRTALEYARDNLRSRPDEARRRVEEVSPRLAAAIWERASGQNAMAITASLALVIGVVGVILALRGSSETPPQTPTIVQNVLVIQQGENAPLTAKEVKDIVRRELDRTETGDQS